MENLYYQIEYEKMLEFYNHIYYEKISTWEERLDDIQNQYSVFVESDSFQGNGVECAKRYLKDTHDLIIMGIRQAIEDYKLKFEIYRSGFYVIEESSIAILSEEVFEKVLGELTATASSVDIIQQGVGMELNCISDLISFQNPSVEALIGNIEGIKGDVYDLNNRIEEYEDEHEKSVVNELTSLCDALKKVLEEYLSNEHNVTTYSDSEVYENQNSILLQECIEKSDQYLAIKYKEQLMIEDENGEWIYDFEKLGEIMNQDPSQIYEMQYMAMIDMFNSFENTNDMEKFIGLSYEYSCDEYYAFYELTPVFRELSTLYAEKAYTEISEVISNKWLCLEEDSEQIFILEQLSRASILINLCKAPRVETDFNSIRPELIGELFLPVRIERDNSEGFRDYNITYFNNFVGYPEQEFLEGMSIKICGIRETNQFNRELVQDCQEFLESGKNIFCDEISGNVIDTIISKGGEYLVGSAGPARFLWIGPQLLMEFGEKTEENNQIDAAISEIGFVDITKVACVDCQVAFVGNQLFFDYIYMDENALKLKLAYYNYKNGENVTIEDIKIGFVNKVANVGNKTFDEYYDWWRIGNKETAYDEFVREIQRYFDVSNVESIINLEILDDKNIAITENVLFEDLPMETIIGLAEEVYNN